MLSTNYDTLNIEQAYKKFKTQVDCINFLEQLRWNGSPRCPHCKQCRQTPLPKEQRNRCGICRASYSVTVRTIFNNSKIDLQKWFVAIPLVIKNKISARQLSKEISVTKDTACFMVSRIKVGYKENREMINEAHNFLYS